MKNLNQHVENYLTYYLNSKLNPGFAVLLQGKWGCGKTWFIKQFIEKHSTTDEKPKFIYITLYGVSEVSEIEDQIFQQLHPILSSKPMALAGKILKGVARASLKFDYDGDNKSDGSLNAQIPDINLPNYLKNTSKCVLVIDDLERCIIPINNLLGYVNSFVEHQDLKVIIIANEEELHCIESEAEAEAKEKDKAKVKTEKNLYRNIKEKLIGKTFGIEHDVDAAYKFFVSQVTQDQAREFLSTNKEKIIEIFVTANYRNLRHLKQSIWDFERFYLEVPSDYTTKSDLMEELLSHFFAFSFEIKSGTILPADIKDLTAVSTRRFCSKDSKNTKPDPPIDSVLKKYPFIKPFEMILPEKMWRDLFDKGYLLDNDLGESLRKSKYCQDNDTPLWVKLYHFIDLEDDEFTLLYAKLLKQWENKEFAKTGEILHVCGLFLGFSDMGLIEKSVKQTLAECKAYIEAQKIDGKLEAHNKTKRKFDFLETDQWGGLGYAGKDLTEFREIYDYLQQRINETKIENLPTAGKELLEILAKDTRKFERMIYRSNTEDAIYYDTPIFRYIDPTDFFEVFFTLPNSKRRHVLYALEERYDSINFDSKLFEEIDFLKKFDSLVSQKAIEKKGSLSGYILGVISAHNLSKIIEKIESAKLTND